MAFVIAELEATGAVLSVLWNTETGPGKHCTGYARGAIVQGRAQGGAHMQNHHHLVGWHEYRQENYFKMPVPNQW